MKTLRVSLIVACTLTILTTPSAQSFPKAINRYSVVGALAAVTGFTLFCQTQPCTSLLQAVNTSTLTQSELCAFYIAVAGTITAFIGATYPYSVGYKPSAAHPSFGRRFEKQFPSTGDTKRNAKKPEEPPAATPTATYNETCDVRSSENSSEENSYEWLLYRKSE